MQLHGHTTCGSATAVSIPTTSSAFPSMLDTYKTELFHWVKKHMVLLYSQYLAYSQYAKVLVLLWQDCQTPLHRCSVCQHGREGEVLKEPFLAPVLESGTPLPCACSDTNTQPKQYPRARFLLRSYLQPVFGQCDSPLLDDFQDPLHRQLSPSLQQS